MSKVKTFLQKFGNDWSMNLSSMLTYSLITTIVPILVAILSIAGIILKLLPGGTYASVVHSIHAAMPPQAQSVINIDSLLKNLVKLTGPLALVSLVGLLWAGSNLFTNVENVFSIIYRVRDRDFLPQRLMAIGMVIVLTILLPASLAASTLVTAGSSAFQSFLPKPLGVVLSIAGPVSAVLLLWILFLVIYRVVPNRHVPYHDAWKGALTAAVMFAIFDVLFPLYFKFFLSGNSKYGAILLSVLVLIAWLWFFAVTLVVGAQVNAVAMRIEPLPYDIARTIAERFGTPLAGDEGRGAKAASPQARMKAGAARAVTAPIGVAGRGTVKGARLLTLLVWLTCRPVVRRREQEGRSR